jgi:hypothetical protein
MAGQAATAPANRQTPKPVAIIIFSSIIHLNAHFGKLTFNYLLHSPYVPPETLLPDFSANTSYSDFRWFLVGVGFCAEPSSKVQRADSWTP